MLGPGEARKRGPKKNGNAADMASENNGDSDCDSSILDESTSRRGSTKRTRRVGVDLNVTPSAKKAKQEDKIKLDLQLSESRVVLTRVSANIVAFCLIIVCNSFVLLRHFVAGVHFDYNNSFCFNSFFVS